MRPNVKDGVELTDVYEISNNISIYPAAKDGLKLTINGTVIDI